MKLNFITMMVRDINQSINFYEQLVALKLVRRFKPEMGEIAFLQNQEGETKLELICFKDTEKISASGLVMNFEINDCLEAIRERALTLGYEPTEIVIHPTKPTYFRVLDPDGIVVEFSK